MRLLNCFRLAVVASSILTCAQAQSIITWSAVSTSTATSDVSLNGDLMVARNLHDGPTNSPTVGGVQFVGGWQPTGWAGSYLNGINGASSGSTSYNSLLQTASVMSGGAAGNPSALGGIRIDNLAPFTPGVTYEIQCWYTDQRGGPGQLSDRKMNLSSAFGPVVALGGEITNSGALTMGSSVQLDANPNNLSGPTDMELGQFAIGTWVHDSSSELWLAIEGSHPDTSLNLRPHLTAFQIRQVYVPSEITWGAVEPATSPTDVSLAGTLVAARNLVGSGASVSPTVNGVSFAGWQPNGWSGTGGMMNGSTTGDAGYDQLLTTANAFQGASTPAGNPSPYGAVRVDTLGSFVPGNTYQIQCWFTDQRGGTQQLYDRQVEIRSAFGDANAFQGTISNLGSMIVGASTSLDADPDNAPAINSPDQQFGSHVTGTFTYSNSAETWIILRGRHPNPSQQLRAHLTALQVRDITEPATVTTLPGGCGGVSLVATNTPVQGSAPNPFQVVTTGIPATASLHVGIVGLGNPSIPAALFGIPGCTLHSSLDVLQVDFVTGSTLAWTPLTLPPVTTSFSGFTFYVQGAALGTPLNSAFGFGGLLSDALECTVGTL